jgi:hypothetical protein
MGWGGSLILSKAQKSAATPTHPLLASAGSTRTRGDQKMQIQAAARMTLLQRYLSLASGSFLET